MRAPLVLIPLVLAACGSSDPPPRRPNVLVLAIDTLRADRLGAYGYERDTSPALDAWMETAVVFEDAQSPAPWTLPAFASILTSTYPSTHSCWGFRSRLDESFTTLPEIFADQGYATYGVASHVFFAPEHGLAQGFETYDSDLIFSSKDSGAAISSPSIVERARVELERLAADDAPWFAWLHFFDPHTVYQPHPEWIERFGSQPSDRYDGEIAFTDRHLGQVLEHLDALGVADQTVVVLVADHGEEFREHGRLGHGKTLFKEVVRVPFAISAPGLEPARIQRAVSTVDLLPTLLDLTGCEAPALPFAGRSLVPVMTTESGEGPPLLQESRLEQREDAELEGLVTERWKLILERERLDRRDPASARARGAVTRTLLFDRQADPREQRNVAAEHPEQVLELTGVLDRLVQQAATSSLAIDPSQALEMDADKKRRLRSLGYLDGD